MPHLDVARICRAVATLTTANPDRRLADERRLREQLAREWTQLAAADESYPQSADASGIADNARRLAAAGRT
jgi:hypothetical protein